MCQVVVPSARVQRPLSEPITNLEIDRVRDPLLRFPPNYPGDLRDGDIGQGYAGQSGAPNGSEAFVVYNDPGTLAGSPIPVGEQASSYEQLAATLIEFQKLDWAEKGSPPNPNIKLCYENAGRGNYEKDGPEVQYAWQAAFVSFALKIAGLENIRTMSSAPYAEYGRPVEWRDLGKIRKYDIAVFRDRFGAGGHVGFVWALNANSYEIEILGGNQGNTYKVSKFPIDGYDISLQHVRRNWEIPPRYDISYPNAQTATEIRPAEPVFRTPGAGSTFNAGGTPSAVATSSSGNYTGQNGRLDPSTLTNIGGPHKLRNDAAQAYLAMAEAARRDGITWSITDSYRTYEAQVDVARRKGLYSQGGLAATPGTSRHGWGLAVDLGLNNAGENWLRGNAARFGFRTIPREPWHWQYEG
jgi:hypothetical protein